MGSMIVTVLMLYFASRSAGPCSASSSVRDYVHELNREKPLKRVRVGKKKGARSTIAQLFAHVKGLYLITLVAHILWRRSLCESFVVG